MLPLQLTCCQGKPLVKISYRFLDLQDNLISYEANLHDDLDTRYNHGSWSNTLRWSIGNSRSISIVDDLRATPTIMQMDLAFTKIHKTPKKKPPIVMHLDFTFYIAMHLERET